MTNSMVIFFSFKMGLIHVSGMMPKTEASVSCFFHHVHMKGKCG